MADPRPLTRRSKFILGLVFLGLTPVYPFIVRPEYLIPYFQWVTIGFSALILGTAGVDAIREKMNSGGKP